MKSTNMLVSLVMNLLYLIITKERATLNQMISKKRLVSLMMELQNQNTNTRKRYAVILCYESPKLHVTQVTATLIQMISKMLVSLMTH